MLSHGAFCNTFWPTLSNNGSWKPIFGLLFQFCFCLFCCFTSQVNSYGHGRRSVHLTTLFPGQAWTSSLPVLHAHTFACIWQQTFLKDSAEGRRMTVEIISWSISTKVWDRGGINSLPLDLQSDSHLLPDMLLTALHGLVCFWVAT